MGLNTDGCESKDRKHARKKGEKSNRKKPYPVARGNQANLEGERTHAVMGNKGNNLKNERSALIEEGFRKKKTCGGFLRHTKRKKRKKIGEELLEGYNILPVRF